MELDPNIGRRISDAARHISSVKTRMERARTFEEHKLLQVELEAAEREMQDAAMAINRGLDRNVQTAEK